MRYHRSPAFLRSMHDLPAERGRRTEEAIRRFVDRLDAPQPLPHGLGLKPLRQGYWELRAGLADRIVFHRTGDLITFTREDLKL